MTRHTARISRTWLLIIGLILLLGGGTVLARGLGASSSVLGGSHTPLLTPTQVMYPTKNSWVWPVAAVIGALIAALALWWMVAQTNPKTVRRMPLEPDRLHGTTTLRANAATGAIVDELESYPAIRSADATLQGSSRTPGLRMSVTAENRADPAALRTSIETEALAHLRTALERDKIPTVLRMQFSRAFDRHIA
jgi:hypothetical protein